MARYFDNMGTALPTPQIETELSKLLRQLSYGVDPYPELTGPEFSTGSIYQEILKDSGKGRISAGLKSLELLSHLRNGVNPRDLFLFDAQVYYGTSTMLSTANSDKLVDIVLRNLGMLEVYSNQSQVITADYYNLCLSMGNRVKAGSFFATDFSAAALKQSKHLVNRYIKTVRPV